MDENREAAHNLRLSEEFQDESGLELSLGLGLSSGDSRHKWKASDGPAPSIPSVDLTGEPAVAGGGNGTTLPGKSKPSAKASGLDAALKKFLEGRLDEQDETGRLLDGSSSFNLQKEKEKPTAAGSSSMGFHVAAAQEKSGQQLDLVSNMDGKGNPFLFKEIQVSSGVTSSRDQSPAHTMPLQFVDAFKIGSYGSASGSPHSAEALGHWDGDEVAVHPQDGLRKCKEARKKRKHLIDEHKHQKKGKKDEDKAGTHGFRRPGSNTWVRGLDASVSALDVDRALLVLSRSEADEQLQQEIRQDKQQESVDMEKGYETDGNESTGIDHNESTGIDHNESTGTGDDSKGVEVNFMPQLQAQDMGKKEFNRADDDAWRLSTMQSHAAVNMQSQSRDNTLKRVSALPNNQQEGQLSALSIGREGEKAGSPLKREREKVPSETSSTGTDGTDKKEEKSRGGIGEASSAPPEMIGSDKALLASTAAPFLPPMATSSAAVPYSLSPFSVVPMPYSLPVSVPNAPGMQFPVGMSFPYLMPYAPPGSDGQDQNSMRPVVSNAFQPPPGLEYLPPQFSSLEGTSWMQALQPPVVSPFSNANNGAVYNRNSMGAVEDISSRPQGTKVHENGGGGQNVSLTVGTSALGNHPLFRAVAHNGTQDPAVAISQLHQAPDLPLLSSSPVPSVPHFSSQRTMSDPVELRSLKEQGGVNAFPGFAASVQAALGLPGALRPPSSGMKEDGGGQEQPKFGGKVETAAGQQVHHRNNTELSNLGQQDFRRALGGQFHQGSTDNLSESDEDMANLQRGIAPGLKFGGTGSPPDLPWVYTTGPNGRSVGGVLYRFSQSQLRIVCACHGKHMSSGEFAQHAGGVDTVNPEKNIVFPE